MAKELFMNSIYLTGVILFLSISFVILKSLFDTFKKGDKK